MDQEEQQELNEILLQSLQERNNGGKPPPKVGRDPKVGDNVERKKSSSQETKKEKVKVQWFLSFFPQSYKDQIEFDNPKTLDEL